MIPENTKLHLRNFIYENHFIVAEYRALAYRYTTSIAQTKYDRLCLMFLSSLEASGGPIRLDAKSKCINNFKILTCSLRNNNNINFTEFASCFYHVYATPKDVHQVVEQLVYNANLPQFSWKKANLFLKELVIHAGSDIFSDFKPDDYIRHLALPVDSVIRKVFAKLTCHPITPLNDDDIQSLAKEMFPESPALLDDLWFWGHFVFNRDELLSGPNEAMIGADKFIDYMQNANKLHPKLEEFIQILKASDNNSCSAFK